MKALFAALAAMRPAVKHRLTETGLIAPTLQMLIRRHYSDVDGEEDYLSAKAHPVVFNGKKIGLEGMVEQAQSLRADSLPPLVGLHVERETFDPGRERRFTTPSAIARNHVGETPHRMRVSAESSFDVNERNLRFKWVLLRGNPKHTRIEPTNDNASKARIEIEPQQQRLDIGVFAHNGAHWSAPAIISVKPASAK